jgi:hypothetical protein
LFGVNQFSEAKIENLCAAIASEKNALRLEIAMNDSLDLCRSKSVCDLVAVLDGFSYRKKT